MRLSPLSNTPNWEFDHLAFGILPSIKKSMSLSTLSVSGKCSEELESLGAWQIPKAHHWYSTYVNATNTVLKYSLHKTFVLLVPFPFLSERNWGISKVNS